MDLIKSVRSALGISQNVLAEILGVSLSMLKQAETNRRQLPMEARRLLAWMYDFVTEDSKQTEAVIPAMSPAWKQKKLRNLFAQLGQLVVNLEDWETKIRQTQSRIKMVQSIRESFPETKTGSTGKRLEILAYEAGLWFEGDNQTGYWDTVLKKLATECKIEKLEKS